MFFGFKIVKKSEYDDGRKSIADRARLSVENEKLQSENEKLLAEVKSMRGANPLIEMDLGDPSPVDREKRKLYVAQVAGLHKEILEPKLKQMISKAHSLAEEQTNDREIDLQIKGVIYAFREMMKWGESMVNEQVANQVGENPASPR